MGMLIDASALRNFLYSIGGCDAVTEWAKGWDAAVDEAIEFVEDMPAIDAVEVVRCKDCKYCDKYRRWSEEEYLGCGINVAEIYSVDPMHYCSHGKRKVGEENAVD